MGALRKKLNKIKRFLSRAYRLSLRQEKWEQIVWEDLKRVHDRAEWSCGVYEMKRSIETVFTINDSQALTFYYMIYDSDFHCRVKILEDYPVELTTDLFVLASHFNNLLHSGVVIVNTDQTYIEYHLKSSLLLPLLFTDEIDAQMSTHYRFTVDIHAAFQRLLIEQEPPAIIIADLLKKNRRDGAG